MAQVTVGISVGALMSGGLLVTLRDRGLTILVATVTTVAASLVAGQLLRLHHGVSSTTASFSSIAGGAVGVVATARDAGADERIVVTVQYLRVLAVILTIPVVVTLLGAPSSGQRASPPALDLLAGLEWSDLLFTGAGLAVGLFLVRLLRFPGNMVLLPMAATTLLSLAWPFGAVSIPELLLSASYLVIGAQVGVKFTRASLAYIARLLPLAVAQIIATVGACFGVALLVTRMTGIPLVDTYLATTPGGLYAVIAVALASDADVGFIFATQVVRLFLALALVPLLAWMGRRRRPDGPSQSGAG
ncbi:hypothetical protein FHS08_000946 [Microbacterium ulmi]|nr:hypothetical protein [Microbacterium ulmi]